MADVVKLTFLLASLALTSGTGVNLDSAKLQHAASLGCRDNLLCDVRDVRQSRSLAERLWANEDHSQMVVLARRSTPDGVETFGGTAFGAVCEFPFTFAGQQHSQCIRTVAGSRPWCKTAGDKWGFCKTEEETTGGQCSDLDCCKPYLNSYFEGTCPDRVRSQTMSECCHVSCGFCECSTPVCQNGASRDGACGCQCTGGWAGHDCSVCALREIGCKNSGTFIEADCSCRCLEGFGGADCSVQDAVDFVARGEPLKCERMKEEFCQCPLWGAEITASCPLACKHHISADVLLMKYADQQGYCTAEGSNTYCAHGQTFEDFGVDCAYDFTAIPNKSVPGGIRTPVDFSTAGECLEWCKTKLHCYAVDWNVPRSRCWYHDVTSGATNNGLRQDTDVIHYNRYNTCQGPNLDDCIGDPCQNGATCVDGDTYICNCPAGYTGDTCQTCVDVAADCASRAGECETNAESMVPNCRKTCQLCSSDIEARRIECLMDTRGRDYIGTLSVTEGGLTCQRWDTKTPHSHGLDHDYQYPDGSVYAASNYCRGVDNEARPWCYTTDPATRWGYCDVPRCADRCADHECENGATCVNGYEAYTCVCPPSYQGQRCQTCVDLADNCASRAGECDTNVEYMVPNCRKTCKLCSSDVTANRIECRLDEKALDYTGLLSVTEDGLTCQRWDSQTPHSHGNTQDYKFPEGSVYEASNYCRNPDNSAHPFCYTTTGKRWSNCDVPRCEDRCVNHECENGATCVNGYEAYTCVCPPSYQGQRCQTCVDVAADCASRAGECDTNVEYMVPNCRKTCQLCSSDIEAQRTECRLDEKGFAYTGTMAVTEDGLTCQRWDSQTPHSHGNTQDYKFPEGSVYEAGNYCRNPDDSARPWCYTTTARWGYCEVPLCDE